MKNIPLEQSTFFNRPQITMASEESQNDAAKFPGQIILGNFRMDFSLKENNLIIEAQHQKTGDFYSRKLTVEDIAEITKRFISNLEEMHESLLLAVSGQDSALSAEIGEDGKFIMHFKASYGIKEKLVNFEIQLDRQNLPIIQICEKTLKRLQLAPGKSQEPFNKQILEVIEKIVEHNSALDEKFQKSLSKLTLLKKELE